VKPFIIMPDKNEVQEVEETLDLPVVADGEEDTTDWKAEATKLQSKASRQREKTKELKAKLAEAEAKLPKESSEKEKTNDVYAEKIDKLTLKGEGITEPDAQKLVLDEAKRLKLPVEEILTMDYMKSKLKVLKDTKEAAEGMPKGRGQQGQAQNNIDVHLAKGTTPTDLAEAEKVINARMAKEKSVSKFSDDLFVG
jgi:type I site-specific restriction endonuclease